MRYLTRDCAPRSGRARKAVPRSPLTPTLKTSQRGLAFAPFRADPWLSGISVICIDEGDEAPSDGPFFPGRVCLRADAGGY
jgi:hypothetical protein